MRKSDTSGENATVSSRLTPPPPFYRNYAETGGVCVHWDRGQ